MAKSVEKEGKTIDEALRAALSELGTTEDKVDKEILAEPSHGFFGLFGRKPARVRVTMREAAAKTAMAAGDDDTVAVEPQAVGGEGHGVQLKKAKAFLQDIFQGMQLQVAITENDTEEGHVYDLAGKDLGILIGKHGQTLDALQYLTNLAANHGFMEDKVRIILDVENYRQRREETLCQLAGRLADKCQRTGGRIVLEPMNRHERKIIHTALQDNHAVVTYSAGDEPYRKVVIEAKHRRRRRNHHKEHHGESASIPDENHDRWHDQAAQRDMEAESLDVAQTEKHQEEKKPQYHTGGYRDYRDELGKDD
jgi:spoIIIJ-associated protein